MIDTHVHLDDPRYDKDREEIIKGLSDWGVKKIINIGADMESTKKSVELADKYENIYAAIGVHPHDAKTMKDKDFDTLRELSKHPKVVAIGEIGLDYYYDHSERAVQKEIFERQILLAKELDMPIVIHSRDAAKDTLDIIKKHIDGLRGEMHCYSYSLEIMREYVKMGFYIALGGVVSFNNARVAKEVAREVPIDYLLLETDSPYLTPHPFRGKRNEPGYVKFVAEKIAEIRNMDIDEIINATTKNAKRLFNI